MKIRKLTQKFPKRYKALAAGFAGIAAFFLCQHILPNILYFNVSPSLPRGIYLAIPGSMYRTGDLVVYEPPDDVRAFCMDRGYMTEEMLFVKYIAAMPRDVYQVNQDDHKFTVNEKYLGIAEAYDNVGRTMPKQYGSHIVPDGEFLPYTGATHSLDGRYTGTVPLSKIKTRLVPLLTEW